MATKVAVVTGANKGIGFAIVRGLCKRFDGAVYLTSRDIGRGKQAVADLEKEGLHPKYHQLDITDKQSVEKFRDYIKSKYEGIDILVNNAGIGFARNANVPISEQAEPTLSVNYFSLVSTCDILFPILKDGARVVNISSSYAHLSNIPSLALREKLKDEKLSVAGLSQLMQQFVEAAKQGTHAAQWDNSSLMVAKVGVTALSNILQRIHNNRDIKVNSVHPGFVDTDLSSHNGPMSIDEGAAAPLYVALDAPDSLRGQLVWFDKQIVPWDGVKPEKEF